MNLEFFIIRTPLVVILIILVYLLYECLKQDLQAKRPLILDVDKLPEPPKKEETHQDKQPNSKVIPQKTKKNKNKR